MTNFLIASFLGAFAGTFVIGSVIFYFIRKSEKALLKSKTAALAEIVKLRADALKKMEANVSDALVSGKFKFKGSMDKMSPFGNDDDGSDGNGGSFN